MLREITKLITEKRSITKYCYGKTVALWKMPRNGEREERDRHSHFNALSEANKIGLLVKCKRCEAVRWNRRSSLSHFSTYQDSIRPKSKVACVRIHTMSILLFFFATAKLWYSPFFMKMYSLSILQYKKRNPSQQYVLSLAKDLSCLISTIFYKGILIYPKKTLR